MQSYIMNEDVTFYFKFDELQDDVIHKKEEN